jgi:hypothetical protein
LNSGRLGDDMDLALAVEDCRLAKLTTISVRRAEVVFRDAVVASPDLHGVLENARRGIGGERAGTGSSEDSLKTAASRDMARFLMQRERRAKVRRDFENVGESDPTDGDDRVRKAA